MYACFSIIEKKKKDKRRNGDYHSVVIHLTFPSLSFPTSKMGILTPTLEYCCDD